MVAVARCHGGQAVAVRSWGCFACICGAIAWGVIASLAAARGGGRYDGMPAARGGGRYDGMAAARGGGRYDGPAWLQRVSRRMRSMILGPAEQPMRVAPASAMDLILARVRMPPEALTARGAAARCISRT